VLCKKIRSNFAILNCTKRTNLVASKKHTSGRDRIFVLSDLISKGLRGNYAENSDQNSKKNFLVLAGLSGCTRKQGCGSGSELDPNSIGTVDPDPNSDPDPDPGGQK
jgi:hypothetical protein